MTDKITYQGSGVDPEKAANLIGEFAAYQKTRPRDPNMLSGIGPFASAYRLGPVLKGMTDPVLVSCCDGVGTKLKLALDWKKLDGLGADLVAMNVNDLLCAGAVPLVFLDYYACGALKGEQLGTLLKSIQQACETAQCSLAGGETAEMPGLYHGEDFDLAGFSVGVTDASRLLGPTRVKPGDVVIAVESSGLHSNGYSLARRIVEREKISPDAHTPFDGRTWKDTLLAPTHIYVKAMKPWLGEINGLVHVTGGGLYENLPRVLSPEVSAKIDAKAWNIPPLFQWLGERAQISTRELLSTFNCGVGLLAICSPEKEAAFIAGMRDEKFKAWRVGSISERPSGTEQVIWA